MKPEHDDKRRADRERTFLAGRAVIGAGFADVGCQVKDLSRQGARLIVPDRATIPDTLELHVSTRGIAERVSVRWREGRVIGVAFGPELDAADQSDSPARIKELEAEVAELRRRIAEMAERLYHYGDREL